MNSVVWCTDVGGGSLHPEQCTILATSEVIGNQSHRRFSHNVDGGGAAFAYVQPIPLNLDA